MAHRRGGHPGERGHRGASRARRELRAEGGAVAAHALVETCPCNSYICVSADHVSFRAESVNAKRRVQDDAGPLQGTRRASRVTHAGAALARAGVRAARMHKTICVRIHMYESLGGVH